jgi:hypothetical protein
MRKSELRTGMRVVMRSGAVAVVMLECKTRQDTERRDVFAMRNSHMTLEQYNGDLTFQLPTEANGTSNYDIIEVREHKYFGLMGSNDEYVSIWKREEKTPAQIRIEAIAQEMEDLAEELKELEVK